MLTEEREDSCTVFKMQMAVVGGTKAGFMLENAPLTAAEPRFEVEIVTDESGRIEHDEQVLAQMGELGASPHTCCNRHALTECVAQKARDSCPAGPSSNSTLLDIHLASQSASGMRRKC